MKKEEKKSNACLLRFWCVYWTSIRTQHKCLDLSHFSNKKKMYRCWLNSSRQKIKIICILYTCFERWLNIETKQICSLRKWNSWCNDVRTHQSSSTHIRKHSTQYVECIKHYNAIYSAYFWFQLSVWLTTM